MCESDAGFSFGRFIREFTELRGTVTDLLIGDLFTDKVDKVDKVGGPDGIGVRPGTSAGSSMERRRPG